MRKKMKRAQEDSGYNVKYTHSELRLWGKITISDESRISLGLGLAV
jgi:hypothetical protein